MNQSTVLETSTPAKVHKNSMPIARNNSAGYDVRPERARTSHACEPCRERKTKCDGERPSCHRCLHTGTGCHYGYGKGWRKRKTAEDLTATSRKLQIYESLLSNIYPRVDMEVQAQIDEARNQEIINMNTPDSADSNNSGTPSIPLAMDRDRSMSGTAARIPMTLPVPHTRPQQAAPPSMSFDRVPESPPPNIAHHPKREAAFEDLSGNRLPSITPQGLLIEKGHQEVSPTFRSSVTPLSASRPEPFSPPSTSPQHGGSAHSASVPRPPSR